MNAKALIAILILVVLTAGWFIWPASENNYPITNENPAGTNIIALGDSLTAGVGAAPEGRYVTYLERSLGVPIINAGISGDTTRGALTRLQRDVLDKDPKIVLVMLGGNDVLRKYDKEETFANLRSIVTQIQASGAMVILVGFDFPLKNYNGRYAALAEELGCPFVPDIFDDVLNDRSLMSDGVHPNDKGYRVFADRIEPVLRKHALPETVEN